MGSGLTRVAKAFGGIKISANGETVEYVYDYAQDKAVPVSEMPFGGERWKASERVKWAKVLNGRQAKDI